MDLEGFWAGLDPLSAAVWDALIRWALLSIFSSSSRSAGLEAVGVFLSTSWSAVAVFTAGSVWLFSRSGNDNKTT